MTKTNCDQRCDEDREERAMQIDAQEKDMRDRIKEAQRGMDDAKAIRIANFFQ